MIGGCCYYCSQSVDASAVISVTSSNKLGESKEDLEEEQLVWRELLLWLDAHLSAHTIGAAL